MPQIQLSRNAPQFQRLISGGTIARAPWPDVFSNGPGANGPAVFADMSASPRVRRKDSAKRKEDAGRSHMLCAPFPRTRGEGAQALCSTICNCPGRTRRVWNAARLLAPPIPDRKDVNA